MVCLRFKLPVLNVYYHLKMDANAQPCELFCEQSRGFFLFILDSIWKLLLSTIYLE